MPIYLARWPDLSAALVRASSEEDLEDVLDEIANPEGCTWSVYRGPLCIEFSLPVPFDVKERGTGTVPLEPGDIVVGDVSALREGDALEVSIPGGDTASRMVEAVQRKAFPHVFRARQEHDREPSERKLRDAILAELQELVRASWRHEHVRRRDDPESRVAVEMGTTPRLVRRWLEAAEAEATTPPVEGDDRPEVQELFARLRGSLAGLEALLDQCRSHWGYEDAVYRFYHHSFKVYSLQEITSAIVAALQALAPERRLSESFLAIVRDGTGKTFEPEHNRRWPEVTRPIVEAFFHAQYFLEMAVRYAKELKRPPRQLPSGWAAFLELYGLR